MRSMVAIVTWTWSREDEPKTPVPGPYLDVRVENEVTAERLEAFANKIAGMLGWRPTIQSVIDVRLTGPLPGDTRQLPCASCLRTTHHQFVRGVTSPELAIGYEYAWQCLECSTKRERVLVHS